MVRCRAPNLFHMKINHSSKSYFTFYSTLTRSCIIFLSILSKFLLSSVSMLPQQIHSSHSPYPAFTPYLSTSLLPHPGPRLHGSSIMVTISIVTHTLDQRCFRSNPMVQAMTAYSIWDMIGADPNIWTVSQARARRSALKAARESKRERISRVICGSEIEGLGQPPEARAASTAWETRRITCPFHLTKPLLLS